MSPVDPREAHAPATAISASEKPPSDTTAGGKFVRGVATGVRIGFSVIVLGIALVLVLLRLALPAIEQHRSEVEDWVSGLLQRSVTIEGLRAHWRGWSPELEIEGLRLHRTDSLGARGESALTFERVRINIDPIESLMTGNVLAHSVVLGGASLAIKRTREGDLIVAGMQPSIGTDPSDVADDLAKWLLRDGRLVFDSATVSWTDERRSNRPLLLTGVRVELVNDGNRHRLNGSFRLPEIGTERIDFAFDAQGDLLSSNWSGQMVLSGDSIDAAQLGTLYEPLGEWVTEGRSDVNFSGNWKNGRLDRTQVKLRADGLTLAEVLGGLRVHGGAVDIQAGRLKTGWSAEVLLSDVYTSEGHWRTTRGSLNYIRESDDGPARLVGRFDYARLADLMSLMRIRLPQDSDGGSGLPNYRTNADLKDLHFSTTLGKREAAAIELTAGFENLSVFEGVNQPSLSGYSGRVEIDGDYGVLTMNEGTVDVALPGGFDGRFLVETKGGRIAWRQGAPGLRVDVYDVGFVGPEFEGHFTGSAQWDDEERGPLISVVADISSDDLAAIRRYIPDGRIPKGLASWMRRAINGGRLEEGNILLHGRMADFPFDHGNGILEARLLLAGGKLDYARGWPSVSGLGGELRLKGRRLDFDVREGHIYGSEIDSAVITMDDVRSPSPVIQIRGDMKGETADGLRFLSESPLREKFENQLRNITVGGSGDLHLELDFPLNRRTESRLAGRITVSGNTIDLPQLETGLRKVKGVLEFDGQGVSAQNVSAVYLDRPVRLELGTTGTDQRNTEIRISGEADNRYVAKHLVNVGVRAQSGIDPTSWLARLKGEAPWLAVIEIPGTYENTQRDIRLRLESDLQGMRVDFPFPVGKDADESRRLGLALNISDPQTRNIQVRYGTHASAAVKLQKRNGGFRFKRGSLHFGEQQTTLPSGDGLYVSGELAQLAVGDWIQTWRSALTPEPGDTPQENELQKVSLDVGRLDLLGSSFEKARVRIDRQDDGSWTTRLNGVGLDGVILVPPDWRNEPLVASFDQIDYRSVSDQDEVRVADPREIPPLRFTCKNFVYDGRRLGVVKLVASPIDEGLNFDTMYVVSDDFEIRGSGQWSHDRQRGHRSDFSFQLHSNDLGKFLSSLGFGNTNASGGATDMLIDAGWDAAPMKFDLRKVKGVLHFRSSKGKLLSVKRGATGRVFGLLTITNLMRRLTLDFSDLFEKGLTYDRMEGSFSLEDGQAYTNNLMMENTTALVELAGRTGLVDEDYDQIMTVTPKISSSIPLAPIWLAEKLFKRQVFDKAFSYKYTITGPWDDPLVDLIEVKRKPSRRDDAPS